MSGATTTVLMAVALVAALGWLGPALDAMDDHSAERDQASALEHLQRMDEQRTRFERAAQRACGPQSPWVEVSPGVIQCQTRHGKPAGRKVRIHPGES